MTSFGSALIALGVGVVLAGAATMESRGDEVTANAAPKATGFGALDYFGDKCARCHGDYGSFYGPTFGKNLNDAQMHDVVRDMAAGPAQAPLDEKNLAVLVAWHRALRDGKPFVSLSKAELSGKGWNLSGEVSPGATLQLNGVAVVVQGHTWKATGASAKAIRLEVTLNGKTTTLDALQSSYSPP